MKQWFLNKADLWGQKILNNIADLSKKENSKVLIVTGAITWTLSALAQCAALCFNKNISKEEKSYLIPQEISESAVNIGLFCAICLYVDKKVKNLYESGKVMSVEIAKLFEITGDKNLKSVLRFIEKKFPEHFDFDTAKEALKEYKAGKTIVCTLAAFGASFLACNIITPYFKNKIAGYFYKKSAQSDKDEVVLNNNAVFVQPAQNIKNKLTKPIQNSTNYPRITAETYKINKSGLTI